MFKAEHLNMVGYEPISGILNHDELSEKHCEDVCHHDGVQKDFIALTLRRLKGR
jgi:hypothetical protein